MKIIRKFLTHVLPGIMKPLRVVWNQVIGFMFLVFAIFSARAIYRAVVNFNGDSESIFRLAFTGIFGILMAFFGITSFLRARKINRS